MQNSEADPCLALTESLARAEVSPDRAADALQNFRQQAQDILRHYGRWPSNASPEKAAAITSISPDTVGLVARMPPQGIQELLSEILQRLPAPVVGSDPKTTATRGALSFDAAFQEYSAWRRHRVGARTLDSDRDRFKRLGRFFAGRTLASITAADVADFQRQRLAQDVTGRTINIETDLLRRIFKWANLSALIAGDEITRFSEKSNVGRAADPSELRRLFKIFNSRPRTFYVHAAAEIALETSARQVELLHVRWQDVNWTERLLHLRRSKTAAGIRLIPLTDAAMAAFQRLHKRAKQKQMAAPEHLVFPGTIPGTRRLDPLRLRQRQSFVHAWRRVTAKAGMRGFRFHDLRHTVVSRLSENGVPTAVIAALAGHTDRSQVERYSHIRLAALRTAVEQLAPKKLPTPAREVSPGSTKSDRGRRDRLARAGER